MESVARDHLGREVTITTETDRILSIVPSITELLFDLGLENRIVGRTKFCIHPEEKVAGVPVIGGTKTLHPDKIRELNPGLIIANQEENTREQIVELAKDFPVWVSDIRTLDDAMKLIPEVGFLTNTSMEAELLTQDIQQAFSALERLEKSHSVLYLIWKKPLMAAASGTFIDSMLSNLGFRNVLADLERYPEVEWGLTERIQPDYIFLSSEPFPFAEKHVPGIQKIFPDSKIVLVDGSYFSWYGSRLLPAAAYFQNLLTDFR